MTHKATPAWNEEAMWTMAQLSLPVEGGQDEP
jgi:hypothetical protein